MEAERKGHFLQWLLQCRGFESDPLSPSLLFPHRAVTLYFTDRQYLIAFSFSKRSDLLPFRLCTGGWKSDTMTAVNTNTQKVLLTCLSPLGGFLPPYLSHNLAAWHACSRYQSGIRCVNKHGKKLINSLALPLPYRPSFLQPVSPQLSHSLHLWYPVEKTEGEEFCFIFRLFGPRWPCVSSSSKPAGKSSHLSPSLWEETLPVACSGAVVRWCSAL